MSKSNNERRRCRGGSIFGFLDVVLRIRGGAGGRYGSNW
jgi:hypothetical protein